MNEEKEAFKGGPFYCMYKSSVYDVKQDQMRANKLLLKNISTLEYLTSISGKTLAIKKKNRDAHVMITALA